MFLVPENLTVSLCHGTKLPRLDGMVKDVAAMRKRSSTDGRVPRTSRAMCFAVQADYETVHSNTGYVHIDIDGALSLIRPIDQDRHDLGMKTVDFINC